MRMIEQYRHVITPDPQDGGIASKAIKYRHFASEKEAMLAEAELRKADALERIADALEARHE